MIMQADAEVVGVDGWKDGWVAATLVDGRVRFHAFVQPLEPAPRTAFAELLTTFAGATIAVDIPIGTRDAERSSDSAAKRFLKDHGATPSSVFTTPTTRTVAAQQAGLTHAQAMANARERGEPGTSIQAWNLIPKIVEVREALATVRDQRVVEAHPECSFRALDERVGASSKKSGLGVARRLRALQERAGYEIDLLGLDDRLARVPMDDLLDAAVLVWTAGNVASTTFRTLPAKPQLDEPVIHT